MIGNKIDGQQVVIQIESYRNSIISYPELKEGIDTLISFSSHFTSEGNAFGLSSASDNEKAVLNDQIRIRIEKLKKLICSADHARQELKEQHPHCTL